MKKRIIILGLILVIGGMGFTLVKDKDLAIVKSLDIYCTLFRELNMFYVDEIDPEELVETSIVSMLKSLDPYTTYIPEKNMDDFNFQTTGEYGGIGSLIRRSGEYTMIAEPYEDFPAAKAGLKAGDILLEIDGKSTKGLEISDISELLKGEPGTELTLKIRRKGKEQPMTFTLKRKNITINNVPYYGMLNNHTGYIRLSNFTTNAGAEAEAALRNLKMNDSLESLVLDLRNNPGGLLIESVRVSNLFLDKGKEIVSTRGKVKQWHNTYKTSVKPVDTEIPLVILVNRASASAAEIVAGAMQDHDRAVIVGQRTFGKGLVQTTRQLKYNAQLKVTTAKYYIPSGRCIQALDYTNRNEDGSVGNVPDSLISAYKTRNGRTVYDGGGIRPDIKVESESLSQITVRLYAANIIFNYATLYTLDHDSIGSPSSFELSDSAYTAFCEYVESRDFEFETASESALQELIETAKKEKYYDIGKDEFMALEKRLSHNNLKDLRTFRAEIQQLIEEEIASRYGYQKGRIKAQLQDDNQLDKALELTGKPGKINNILMGMEGTLAIGNRVD